MPNHVRNRLIIKAESEQLKAVLVYLQGDNYEDGSPCYIDFSKIIPMPDELDIDSNILGELGMIYILFKSGRCTLKPWEENEIERFENLAEDRKNASLELGLKYLMNRAKYGFDTWFEWKRTNWGTKWNAYDQIFEEPNVLLFNTAWNGITVLIEKLSCQFPDVEFAYTYADENTGYNTGKGIIKNGISDMYCPEGGSIESYDLYFELHPEDREYYELTEEGYEEKEVEDAPGPDKAAPIR